MSQTTTPATQTKRWIEWLGSLDKEFDPQTKKLVAVTFKKRELRTTSVKGQLLTSREVAILNEGLPYREGSFHSIWVENTEKNRGWDPIKLDITAY